VLYSGHVLKEALNGEPNDEIASYRLWLAQYGSDYDLPLGYDKLWGWQYTEDGDCPGIQSPVDLNAYYGTAEQLRADWDGSGIAPPAPEEIEIVVTAPRGVKVRVVYKGER
jgi:GH25 family lysozyme M1 (1,4-beta-N-acetylmuramidase)